MRALIRLAGLASLASISACTSSPAAGNDAAVGPPDAWEDDAYVAPPRDAGPPVDAYVAPPPVELGRHTVTVTETRRIVPSDGIPTSVEVMHSNNNLDVIRFEGRTFLLWRTSPDHFAGPETVMHLVSSTDEVTWTDEASFTMGTDLREPRFLEVGGHLFAYVSILGTSAITFDPQGVVVTERRADGTWTTPEAVAGLDGYIAWRTRTVAGTPYMLAYLHGEDIYNFTPTPMLELDFLTTTDGRIWTPVDPARRTVYAGGGSESDFALADDGSLYAIIRNEAGDASGFGSLVCHAPAGDLANWSCVHDPRKYDSPLVFAHDGEIYLVGRRNLTPSGAYDLGLDASFTTQSIRNATDYWMHTKRCSLWRFVQGEDRIAYVLDLPSRGDTCFASALPGASPDEIVLYDYSSDIDGPDVPWMVGQAGRTFIYRHVLTFAPRP